MNLTHGSLFSGIGGFERGAQLAGIDTVWNCEIVPFNRQILKQHFPDTKQYEDIRELRNPEPVGIISGGFPCQDLSVAGKGKGITGERSGLWSEMYRIIDETRPAYVVIENSPELLKKGFEKVLYPLSEIGYDAEWQCLFASQFGLPHRRERVFVIAYNYGIGCPVLQSKETQKRKRFTWKEINRVSNGRISDFSIRPYSRDVNGISSELDRIAACGNAVTPNITHYLFECIKEHYNTVTA